MKKKLLCCTKGFILLESLLSLAILTGTVLLLETTQIQMLKETKKEEVELQMLRVLYEEVRERRIYDLPEATYTLERNGTFSIQYRKQPTSQAKISAQGQSQVICREK